MKTTTHAVGDTIGLASTLSWRLRDFLSPLLDRLDHALDRRLVKTFAATIEIFLQQRYRASGLLLSELGAFLASPAHAPAGTKRLSGSPVHAQHAAPSAAFAEVDGPLPGGVALAAGRTASDGAGLPQRGTATALG